MSRRAGGRADAPGWSSRRRSSVPPTPRRRGGRRSPRPATGPDRRLRAPGCGTGPPGKRVKDAVPAALGDAVTGIGDPYLQLRLPGGHRDEDGAAPAIVLYGVFREVEEQPVYEGVAAGHGGVALPL